jgi:hypothetical protein
MVRSAWVHETCDQKPRKVIKPQRTLVFNLIMQ